MRKSIFLILVLALIAAFSALLFTGCGDKPSGGGDAEIERPTDGENDGDTGDKGEENDGDDTGDSDKNDEKPEDNDDKGGDKKPEESEKPDYRDPYEDGGWTGWQKP